MTEPLAADAACEHHYETRILGGHPIAVRACTFCRTPDWNDLREQADELYRWGWQEGHAGEEARETLSAYDKPRPSLTSDPFSYEERQRTGRNAGLCTHPEGYDGECPCPPSCDCCQVTARTTPDNPLRDQLAEAIESEIYEYRERTMFWGETVGVTQEIARLATRGAMEAIERHLDTGEEQAWCKTCRRVWDGRGHRCEDGADATAQRLLDQRQELAAERYAWQERGLAAEAALAACTAQLVRDQAALAAAKKCARDVGAWGVLQAIDNASTPAPAPDGGPTVAEAAADDRLWALQQGGE